MIQKQPKIKPIDFTRLGQDFYRCYFGDSPDVSVTDLSRILGVGGQRKWAVKFQAWIELWKFDCVIKKGHARVTEVELMPSRPFAINPSDLAVSKPEYK